MDLEGISLRDKDGLERSSLTLSPRMLPTEEEGGAGGVYAHTVPLYTHIKSLFLDSLHS